MKDLITIKMNNEIFSFDLCRLGILAKYKNSFKYYVKIKQKNFDEIASDVINDPATSISSSRQT